MDQRKILIVDDDPGISTLLNTILRREGYITFVAGSASAGFKAYHEYKPDLILLDIAMPGVDGIELARMIRTEESDGQHTPIVFLTAHGKESYPDDISALRIDGHLMKPITPAHLRTALVKYFN